MGNIELHVRASDWKKHAHQKDKHYRNVMLHVVWENGSPLLFAYGCLRGEPILRHRAIRWLATIPAEKNALVAGWGRQGVYSKHATDTQALLELKTRYCDPKKCLECAIGNILLRP